MATKKEIMDRIGQLLSLGRGTGALRLNRDTIDRAYEAYVWSLCKYAVEIVGGQAVLKGINTGINPNPIILRGNHGHMASRAQNYCYINCKLGEKAFEIHLDVQYEGTSKALHEIDVSIYDHDSADEVRKKYLFPKSAKIIAAAECKFYTAASPGIAQGRQFVGLLNDFGPMKVSAFVSNRASQNLSRYFSNKSSVDPFTDLVPGALTAENLFVYSVAQTLRKWAQ